MHNDVPYVTYICYEYIFSHTCMLDMSFQGVLACVIVCTIRREGRIAFSVQWFGYGLQVWEIVVEFTAEDKSWSVQAFYGVHPPYWVESGICFAGREDADSRTSAEVTHEWSSPFTLRMCSWNTQRHLCDTKEINYCCSGVIYNILFILHIAWMGSLWR